MVIIWEHQYELGRPWNEQKRYLITESFEVYKQKLLRNEFSSFSNYSKRSLLSIIEENDKLIKIIYYFSAFYPERFLHEGIIVDNNCIFKFGEDMIYDAINKKYVHSEEELHESLH